MLPGELVNCMHYVGLSKMTQQNVMRGHGIRLLDMEDFGWCT